MTFGAGFLMRPLGAIVLGAHPDLHRRRAGLILTLSLMSVGIVSIAFTPGYATIGLLAPLLILFGRLLQGFSAGMELGGVSVYLSEIATPGHKGFYVSCSWQLAVGKSASRGHGGSIYWSHFDFSASPPKKWICGAVIARCRGCGCPSRQPADLSHLCSPGLRMMQSTNKLTPESGASYALPTGLECFTFAAYICTPITKADCENAANCAHRGNLNGFLDYFQRVLMCIH
jgi:hypothetical protein